MTSPPVFRRGDWDQTADGVWEARSAPDRSGDPPPFEAICHLTRDTAKRPSWRWDLYHAVGDSQHGHALDLVESGTAPTLSGARRSLDRHAQLWRDDPIGQRLRHRLTELTDHSIVTCLRCGAHHRLGALLSDPAGVCGIDRPDGTTCQGSTFGDGPDAATIDGGLSLDALAEAVLA